MPEALETWPLDLLGRLLPRHLEIIFEINQRFLDEIRTRFPGDEARVQRMSLIGEQGTRSVRMANLASVASHRINGVAALHSRLLRETVLRDFAETYPERFTNVTNGVTPRRFVALSNPALARLITDAIGDRWLVELDRLRGLERFADDAAFRERFDAVKRGNKERFAHWLGEAHGLHVEPGWMLDVQCKRIHEYKRQLLNLLHALWRFERLRHGEPLEAVPRTIVLAGKAAPAYATAKLIIRLAHAVSDAVERDPRARRLLRVVFAPDFNVKNAQRLYPAAELSEQISTAGMEASGTGNMKLAMNGALTIGTLDGANVEIREAVGAEHFFLFGMTAEEVVARRAGYRPRDVVAADPELARVLDLLASGELAGGDASLFRPLVTSLLDHDPFFVLADFRAYVTAQEDVSRRYADPLRWTRSAILNVARMGGFSSDRSIDEYARTIWEMSPVRVSTP
jgi:starch phosphorylase